MYEAKDTDSNDGTASENVNVASTSIDVGAIMDFNDSTKM